MKKTLFLLSLGLFSFSTLTFAQDKVALVIGNAKYKDAPLKNPVNDAKDMKTALEKAGFTVIYAENADIEKMDEATDKFLNALDRDALGVFFYSGHGIQASGVNYLIPIGSKITNEATLKRQSYDANALVSQLQSIGNSSNIVILDACRDNSYEQKAGTKSFANVSKGLAKIDTTSDAGLLIAYATTSGKTASDNQKEKNGLYTKYLKQYLFQSGLTVEAALKKVRQSVVKENPEQIPWDNSSLLEDVCLAGCSTTLPVTSPKTSYAPLLSFVSGADSTNQNKSYTVKFKATDEDGDLSKILVDWGDGKVSSKTAKNGATVSFSYTYKIADSYNLVATAIDKQNNESDTFEKMVEVKEIVTTKPIEKPVVTVKIPDLLNVNASPSSIVLGSQITFNAKLSAALPNNHKVKINYNGVLVDMSGSGSSFSFKTTPSDLGSSIFIVGIYDSKNALVSDLTLKGNFSVSEPAPVVIVEPKPVETPKPTTTKGDVETFVSGDRTFSYTKIANDGSELPKDAKLGTGAKDWACTKDNNTGLIWEVKTESGLRSKDWTYTWYNPDSKTNGGFEGHTHSEYAKCSTSDNCNTYAFTNAVNKQGLCGAKDWRLPESEELRSLVVCSDDKYADLGKENWGFICKSNENGLTTTSPTINTIYFPNTQAIWFWSSSPNVSSYNYSAWGVVFDYGNAGYVVKSSSVVGFVRLVRG